MELTPITAEEFEAMADFSKYGFYRVIMTPELAASLLKRNIETNRKMKNAIVDSYVHDITLGKWNTAVSDPIRFSKTGKLIDGQHRLQALVKSGCNITMLIITGLEEDDYRYVDNGSKRRVDEIINAPKARNVSAIIRRVINIEHGVPIRSCGRTVGLVGSIHVCTNQDIVDAYNARNNEFIEYSRISQHMRAMTKCGPEAGYGTWFYIAKTLHGKKANEFLEMYLMNIGIAGTAYETIRNKALNGSLSRGDTYVIGTLLQAMSLWLAGKDHNRSVLTRQSLRIDKYDKALANFFKNCGADEQARLAL